MKSSVVLLHGLGRQSSSMRHIETALSKEGYDVLNIGYPSHKHQVETLVDHHVVPKIVERFPNPTTVHFVTHSMGGILLRYLAKAHPTLPIGKAVMLAPPNNGSEVVDRLGSWWLFKALHGPAGNQLSTHEHNLPKKLGRADFHVGVITGDRSINPLLSRLIPGPNDGKVSVISARLEGMKDFMVLPVSHPMITSNTSVISHISYFLQHGQFDHQSPKPKMTTRPR